jgi:hypothetical protein
MFESGVNLSLHDFIGWLGLVQCLDHVGCSLVFLGVVWNLTLSHELLYSQW